MRFGIGYDVHRLTDGRALILGGVVIPFEKGLDGHSDADVLIHAIMDALLGACGQGDIGRHFPDSDPGLRGISSLRLLERVVLVVREAGYRINNVDSVVVAQQPKLAPYIDRMACTLADTMQIARTDINVKATTTEGLGFTGTGEGIAAYAVAGLDKNPDA